MKKDTNLQQKVQDALHWDSLLQHSEIGVSAEDGIVTLTGFVDSYAKKLKAEAIVKDIKGVSALVEKIEVKFGGEEAVTDAEIANQVVNVLKWNWEIPNDAIKVQVENNWVTLEGSLQWNYQRETVKNLVNNLSGIRGN